MIQQSLRGRPEDILAGSVKTRRKTDRSGRLDRVRLVATMVLLGGLWTSALAAQESAVVVEAMPLLSSWPPAFARESDSVPSPAFWGTWQDAGDGSVMVPVVAGVIIGAALGTWAGKSCVSEDTVSCNTRTFTLTGAGLGLVVGWVTGKLR